MYGEDIWDAEVEKTKAWKSVPETMRMSEKEKKCFKLVEVRGVEMPNADSSRNYISDTFASCGMGAVHTNKTLLDAMHLW